MNVIGPINSGAAVGNNGAATANADSSITVSGTIRGIYVRYNDTPPATTDVVVKTKGNTAPSHTLLTISDANADGMFYPMVPGMSTVDGAALTDQYTCQIVHDVINVAIAGANAADSVDVWLFTT